MHRDLRMRTRWLGGGIAAVFLAVGVTPVLASPLAYLLNLDDPSISVVDTTWLTETATIALPDMPSAIVAGASGTRVYVSLHDDTPTGGLAEIDVATHAVRTVSFGQVAAGLAVDAAESRAFVADVAEVAVVDLAGPSLSTTFSDGTRFPFDVAIDHTTGRLYVTNFDGFVSVHDGTTFAPIASIPADFDLQTIRSEEHTSELQSLRHLVCRLLLEKKKNRNNTTRVNKQKRKRHNTDKVDSLTRNGTHRRMASHLMCQTHY